MTQEELRVLEEGTCDYIAFSYYMSNCDSAQENVEMTAGNLLGGVKNPYLQASAWGWQIAPKGLRYFLNEIYDRYQKPIMVVENGLGQSDVLKQDGPRSLPHLLSASAH